MVMFKLQISALLITFIFKSSLAYSQGTQAFVINLTVKESPRQWLRVIGYWQNTHPLDSAYVVHSDTTLSLHITAEYGEVVSLVPSVRGASQQIVLEQDTTNLMIDYSNTPTVLDIIKQTKFDNSRSSNLLREKNVFVSSIGWEIAKINEKVSKLYAIPNTSNEIEEYKSKICTLENVVFDYLKDNAITTTSPVVAGMFFQTLFFKAYLWENKSCVSLRLREIDSVYQVLNDRYGHSSIFKLRTASYSLEKDTQAQKPQSAINSALDEKLLDKLKNYYPEAEIQLQACQSQVVLVDVWASWCGPCRQEIKYLKQVYERFEPLGFTILSVSIDDTAPPWDRAISQDGTRQWQHILDPKGRQSMFTQEYNIKAIPYNFLLDEQGRIIATNIHGEELINVLKQRLINTKK